MKDTKTERLLNQVQSEIQKALASAPSFGVVTIALHFMDTKIKRVVVNREESILTEAKNEG